MKVLLYNDLDYRRLKPAVERTLAHLEKGDFRAADVRKMANGPYYRAKLNDADRLLFRYGRYCDETCLLILEVIPGHAYETSRFLNGAAVDENKLIAWTKDQPAAPEEALTLPYINPGHARFHLLDKPLSFDDRQDTAWQRPPPLIIIGSAGSGKTALVVEKLKQLTGRALYVTLSPYLSENARNLYHAHRYDNPRVEIDFLSFEELLQTMKIPEGREVTFRDFAGWFARHRSAVYAFDAHPLFEEFRGVLTGWKTDAACLSREDYLTLGVKQSIFLGPQKPAVYNLFEKYVAWLKESRFREPNMTAHAWLPLAVPTYDFVVIDEVQDLTNVQVQLALALLKQTSQFILCGDANQLVHPNFFSWSHLKSFFFEKRVASGAPVEISEILDANYRNAPEVTELANKLLLIKNARFGSIDRESNYLVRSRSDRTGKVELMGQEPGRLKEIDEKTRRSTQFAVITMRDEDKAAARAIFKSPLLFSVQEAKGLEYENIILFNVISGHADQFDEIVAGVSPGDLARDELSYARAKDKSDKSLDAYKFFINALYVAVTRSMRNLILVEARTNHRLFDLLGLRIAAGPIDVVARQSSAEEWAQEARRLEKQGKKEQADRIRETMLGQQPVPWTVVSGETLPALKKEALDPERFNKQAKQLLFEFAILHSRFTLLDDLAALKFNRAKDSFEHNHAEVLRKYHRDAKEKNWPVLRNHITKHGVDYRDPMNNTPLMLAAQVGDPDLARYLLKLGANNDLADSMGRTPFHVALWTAKVSPEYATRHLGALYELLAPSHINIRIDDRLIKLDASGAEFFILNYMIGIFQYIMLHKGYWDNDRAFETDDFVHTLSRFPPGVIPDYRRKRAYLSAVLARNEVHKDAPNNRRMFIRVQRGFYLPNPRMLIQQGDAWTPFYTYVRFDDIAADDRTGELTYMLQWLAEYEKTTSIAGDSSSQPTSAT